MKNKIVLILFFLVFQIAHGVDYKKIFSLENIQKNVGEGYVYIKDKISNTYERVGIRINNGSTNTNTNEHKFNSNEKTSEQINSLSDTKNKKTRRINTNYDYIENDGLIIFYPHFSSKENLVISIFKLVHS